MPDSNASIFSDSSLWDANPEIVRTLAMISMSMSLVTDLDGLLHDLRSPLQTLVMANSALLSSPEQASTDPSATRLIQHSLDRIEQTVGGLALPDLSNNEVIPISFREQIEYAIDLWPIRRARKRVDLQVECATDLPAVLGAPGAVQFALYQIIRNACEAASHNPQPQVQVLVTSTATLATATISDNGSGIAQIPTNKVFDAYASNKPRTTHLGLGLALSRQLLAGSGAKLSLGEQQGTLGGADFDLSLPALVA